MHRLESVVVVISFFILFLLGPVQMPNFSWAEPDTLNKYMKSSASEPIRKACFNLERLGRSFRLAQPGISPLERLWNGFDSDAELFMYLT